MQLTNFLLVVGAIGAMAHPSGIAHHHARHHRRGDAVHIKNVHQKPAPKATSTSATAVAAAAAPTAKPPSEDKSNKDQPTSDEYIPFCGSNTAAAKAKRVTYEQVMYKGNLGTANGCDWNSNMMLVPNNIAHKYLYGQEYINVASEPYEVICANKLGPDGRLTGMFETPGQNVLRFMLAPGESKFVVSDTNTQGVCAFAPHSIPKTPHGQWAGVWAEFDFANTSNGGWSGADCSSLVAQHYDMDVPGCRMSEGGVDSTILPGGIGDNAYTRGMEELDGIGLNIVPGKTLIKVYVGFSG